METQVQAVSVQGQLVTVRVESVGRADMIVEAHNRRVDRLNKRGGAGIGHATLTKLGTRVVNVTGQGGVERRVFLADLDVVAPRAIIAGWEICAVLSNTEAGYLAARVSGSSLALGSDDLQALALRGGDCDHCKAARRRNTTYVVREVGGSQGAKLVGSGCVSDFTGHKSPASLIAYADALSGFDAELAALEREEAERVATGGYSGRGSAMALVAFLSFVRAAIRAGGWVSRAEARDRMIASTSDTAWASVEAVREFERVAASDVPERDLETGALNPEFAAARDVIKPTAADVAAADADLVLVEEVLAAKGSLLDDFEANVAVVVNQGFAFARNIGVAAAICRMASHIRERAARAGQASKNEWFGTVAKREVFTLSVVHTSEFPGQFGITTLYVFRDAEGRTGKWFSSAGGLDKGATYEIKGTVKEHAVYKGSKETLLSRCAVVKKLEAPAA